MVAAASATTDYSKLVDASRTSDKFTGWKSDPTTGTLVKVGQQDQDTTADELQNRFIKLLVAQLKNQDPNNPLNNNEVTAQMAQLSTVTGIQGLNDTFKSMAAMMTASQTLQSAPLVGREVMFAGNVVMPTEAGPGRFGFSLEGTADNVQVEIRTKSGELVDTMQIGRRTAGMQLMEWNGQTQDGRQMAPGEYTFTVNATAAGKDVKSTSYSVARVDSVAQDAAGAVLQTPLSQTVKFEDVKRVF